MARRRPSGASPPAQAPGLGESTVPADRLQAQRPGHVWALDFQFDQTADGRVLKLLNVVDEFTREALAMHVARRIDADQTVAVLERLAARRGAPAHVRCDNGPELTAHALRDWCRFSRTETAFIEPGSPWQNAYVESFNGRVRDELLDVSSSRVWPKPRCSSATGARTTTPDGRIQHWPTRPPPPSPEHGGYAPRNRPWA